MIGESLFTFVCFDHSPAYGNLGRDPFNQNFRKFRPKTQWMGSVQLEKFRKNWSTFWGGPLFPVWPVRILVEWLAPLVSFAAVFRDVTQRSPETTEFRQFSKLKKALWYMALPIETIPPGKEIIWTTHRSKKKKCDKGNGDLWEKGHLSNTSDL